MSFLNESSGFFSVVEDSKLSSVCEWRLRILKGDTQASLYAGYEDVLVLSDVLRSRKDEMLRRITWFKAESFIFKV